MLGERKAPSSQVSSGAEFLRWIYDAEREGRRLVIDAADPSYDNFGRRVWMMKLRTQSRFARTLSNIFTFGKFGREQDKRILLALQNYVVVGIDGGHSDERKSRLILTLQDALDVKHKGHIVKSSIRGLNISSLDFGETTDSIDDK